MVFLNPSILLGLIAASIPILIHLLNFRKLKKVEFSTLDFLKELQKSKIKKIKIKQWILLLLRTLIIAFIIFAFARPTLETTNFIGASSTAKSSTFFIIDNSYSMSLVGSDGSNFNQGKKLSKKIISQMEDGDEIIIYYSSDSSMVTTKKETALAIIDDLEISLKFETTMQKLEKAAAILNDKQNINKEIFLFTDFQLSSFKNQRDSINKALNRKGIILYSFDMSTENSGNIAISNLNLENAIVELNKPLTFSAIVTNYAGSNINNLTASLFLNNKRVAQQNFNLDKDQEKTIEFKTSESKDGLIEAKVQLEDDKILQDNISYFDFVIPKSINVLIVYDNNSDINFLKKALNSSSISNQIIVTQKKSTEYITNLNKFNVVFYVSSSSNQFSIYQDYLRKGGKLVFIPPSSVRQSDLDKLTQDLKLPLTEKIISTSLKDNNYSEFGKIDFRHPIFENLFEKKNKREIESPNIIKYIKFRESPNVKSIIRLIDNSIFMGIYSFGKGRVLFFNSATKLSWSDFPVKGIFAPIVSRIVNYLTSTNDKLTSYMVGQSIPVDVSQLTFPLINVKTPYGLSKINIVDENKKVLAFNKSTVPGSYKFYNRNNLIAFATVNVDPKESDLTKLDNEVFEESFNNLFKNNYFVFNPAENYLDKIKQSRYGTELWKYMLIIALMLALVEMFIARSTKKDLMTVS